jgi:hypothetical protein
MKQRSFGYTLSRILGPARRRRVHTPLFLVFPGERLDKERTGAPGSFHLLKFF